MSEEIEITPEQIAAYQRKQQAQAQAIVEQCMKDVVSLLNSYGCTIEAIPQFTPDGRTVATWGIKKQ